MYTAAKCSILRNRKRWLKFFACIMTTKGLGKLSPYETLRAREKREDSKPLI